MIDTVTANAGVAVRDAFAARLMASYVIGGRSEGTAHRLSDIDMVAVLRFKVNADDQRCAAAVRSAFQTKFGVRLDLVLRGSAEIRENGCEYIALGSTAIQGDLPFPVPLPGLPRYQAKTWTSARRTMLAIRGLQALPDVIGPPRASSPTFGYLDPWGPERARQVVGLTANLVRFELALRGTYTAYKSDNLRRYLADGLPDASALDAIYAAARELLDADVLDGREQLDWPALLRLEQAAAAHAMDRDL